MTHPTKLYARALLLSHKSTLLLCLAALLLTLLACAAQPNGDSGVTIGAEGGTLSLANGAQLTLPPEGMSGEVQLQTETISAAEFQKLPADSPLSAAAEQLPAHLILRSDVYQFAADGSQPTDVRFSLPLPTEAGLAHRFDLYGWDAAAGWRWLPTRYEPVAAQVSSQLEGLPAAVALMETEAGIPLVSLVRPPETPLAGLEGVVSDLLATGLPGFTVAPDGSLGGTVTNIPAEVRAETTAEFVPVIRNFANDGELSAEMAGILRDPARRQRHQESLMGLAMSGGYSAISLDYRLDAAGRAEFSAFVGDLATALHQQNRRLLVRVAPPVQVSATAWDSGAYDLLALGRAADRIQLPLPIEPDALAQGQIESLLNWAASQVERSKLQPLLSLEAVEVSGGRATPLRVGSALVRLGHVELPIEGNLVPPGVASPFSLPSRLASAEPEIDPVSGMLHLTISDDRAHALYLPTAASLSRWLERLAGYRLAGIAIDHLLDAAGRESFWPVLRAYRSGAPLPAADEARWLWTITGAEGQTSRDTRPLSAVEYEGVTPDAAGDMQVEVGLTLDGGQTGLPLSSLALVVSPRTAEEALASASSAGDTVAGPTATPTPRPTPTVTPTPTRAAPPPTATPLPSKNCPDSRAEITYPIDGSTIRGVVPFMGTAYLDNLKAYKFEYRPAGSPTWQFLVQFDYTWVTDDKLMDFYTSTVAPGVYDFRMIVVDMTGNYPTPCEIQVTVAR